MAAAKKRTKGATVEVARASAEASPAAASTAGLTIQELLERAQHDRFLEVVLLGMSGLSMEFLQAVRDCTGLQAPDRILNPPQTDIRSSPFLSYLASLLASDSSTRSAFLRRIGERLADAELSERAAFWYALADLWKCERSDDLARMAAAFADQNAPRGGERERPRALPKSGRTGRPRKDDIVWVQLRAWEARAVALLGARVEARRRQRQDQDVPQRLLESLIQQAAGERHAFVATSRLRGGVLTLFEHCNGLLKGAARRLLATQAGAELLASQIKERRDRLAGELPFRSVPTGAKSLLVESAREALNRAAVVHVTALLREPALLRDPLLPYQSMPLTPREVERFEKDRVLPPEFRSAPFTELERAVRAVHQAREARRDKSKPPLMHMQIGKLVAQFPEPDFPQRERERICKELLALADKACSGGQVVLGNKDGKHRQSGPRNNAFVMVARLVFDTPKSRPTVRNVWEAWLAEEGERRCPCCALTEAEIAEGIERREDLGR